MAIAFSHLRRQTHLAALIIALAATGTALASGLDVKFDFARVVEFQDTTPAERAELYPHERLVSVRLPISGRFQGHAEGEVEHLDIEIDGSPSGLRIDSFAPETQLTTEAVAVETTTKKLKERSLGAKLGAAIPVPMGPIVADVGPAVSGGMTTADEATEKIQRLPPKRPIVVSGTFAESRAVFFKLKPSTQTSLEGVHEIVVTFVAPADWRGGSVRIACVARGNKSVWWTTQPTVFGKVDDALQLYPAGNLRLRAEAVRQSEAPKGSEDGAWGLGDLFVRGS